jgi:gliding motility-associated protein GldL
MSSIPQQTTGKKKIGLNAVISWGASVVIIGLMFKILHWPGATWFIAIGLTTEALLFGILGFAAMEAADPAADPNAPLDKKASGLDDLLATAITPKVIEGLSKGFDNFNKTVAQVNQVAGSFTVTQALIKEIESATGDVKKFRDNMGVVVTSFDGFNKSMQSVGQMTASSQAMIKDFEVAGQGMKSFAKNITDMNANFDQFTKTLAAINQMTASSATMLKEFEAATVGMKAYNKNLTDLSKVYQAQLDAFRKN